MKCQHATCKNEATSRCILCDVEVSLCSDCQEEHQLLNHEGTLPERLADFREALQEVLDNTENN